MSYAHSFLWAYLWWRDQSVRREHSDGWQDREVCFTDIQPNSISLFYRSSLDSLLAMRQSCSARLKSLVWCGCKKIHRFRVLIKAFLVKKKGTKLQFWTGWPKGWRSLDQWWPRLHLATPWLLHCPQEHAVKGTRPCCATLEKRKKTRGARKSLFIFESQFCLLMILMDSQV